MLRDIEERGRDLEHVLHQYTTLVKPAFEEFCIPTKKYADVIVPRGAENVVAIDLIKLHIQVQIWFYFIPHVRFEPMISGLQCIGTIGCNNDEYLPTYIKTIPTTCSC